MVNFTGRKVTTCRVGHFHVLAEKDNFHGSVVAMAKLDHFEADVLLDYMPYKFQKGQGAGQSDHSHALLVGLRLSLLDPWRHLSDDVWSGPVQSDNPQHAEHEVLDEFAVVRSYKTFHESEAVLRVFLNIVLNTCLNFLLLMFDFEVFRQVSVLLEANPWFHWAFKERPTVGEE